MYDISVGSRFVYINISNITFIYLQKFACGNPTPDPKTFFKTRKNVVFVKKKNNLPIY